MFRTLLLTTAAVIALAVPAYAEEGERGVERLQSTFSNTITAIKDWFGPAQPQTEEANVEAIEPAAGSDADELLQIPPQYVGPQSEAPARATAFDTPSVAAFGDSVPSAADMAAIAPASGDETSADLSQVDCEAVLKAADNHAEGADIPDTAIIEACETKTDASGEPIKDSAQPGFEDAPRGELPQTQPAAGEPPVGGAVMPGKQ